MSMNHVLWPGILLVLASLRPAFAAERTALTNCSISARVLGTDGTPAAASITFWRAVEQADEEPKTADEFWAAAIQNQLWTDHLTGTCWRPIHNYGAGPEATLEKLAPGDYRVTAALGQGPTPYGLSWPIHLDRRVRATNILLQLQAGPSLTITAVDQDTLKPIALYQALLLREDGLPVACWSSSWPLWSREEDGAIRLPQLAPGRYRLDVRSPAMNASQPEYRLAKPPMDIRVRPGVDQQVTAHLKPAALSEEVIRERWPFVVTGRVTDEQGKGIEGVVIIAHCGMGTLLPTGKAQSNPEGRYTLRFAPGMRTKRGGRWGTGLQAATISPSKPGYAEANLHRQGDLLMAEELPAPNENAGWKVDRTRLVLPEKPYELNFVMVAAAAVEGRLVDEKDRPLANQRLYVSGKELPPSSSILAEVNTDTDGRFRHDGIPTDYFWWFTLAGPQEVKSRSFSFDRPAEHHLELRLATQDGKALLDLSTEEQ